MRDDFQASFVNIRVLLVVRLQHIVRRSMSVGYKRTLHNYTMFIVYRW